MLSPRRSALVLTLAAFIATFAVVAASHSYERADPFAPFDLLVPGARYTPALSPSCPFVESASSAYMYSDDRYLVCRPRDTDRVYMATLTTEYDGEITRVAFLLTRSALAGDLIARYGYPACVREVGRGFTAYWDGVIAYGSSAGQFTPFSRVSYAALADGLGATCGE